MMDMHDEEFAILTQHDLMMKYGFMSWTTVFGRNYVAQFQKLPKEAFQRGRGGNKGRKLDLAPYMAMVEGLDLMEGGILTLDAEDQQRTTKRRLTIAAHSRGFGVKWRTAAEGQLRFQLVEMKEKPKPEASATPGKRGRKAKAAV